MYEITAQAYLKRASELLRQGAATPENPELLYCAWELRNTIERYLFELLVLFNGPEVSKKMEKLYAAGRLSSKLKSLEPEFEKKLKFTNLVIRGMQLGSDLPIPDLDKMSELYGNINDFLHAPKRPEITSEDAKWWGRLSQLANDASNYLAPLVSRMGGAIRLNETGREKYEAWKAGEVTDEEVIKDVRDEISKAGG